jgi:hypothetical protein
MNIRKIEASEPEFGLKAPNGNPIVKLSYTITHEDGRVAHIPRYEITIDGGTRIENLKEIFFEKYADVLTAIEQNIIANFEYYFQEGVYENYKVE